MVGKSLCSSLTIKLVLARPNAKARYHICTRIVQDAYAIVKLTSNKVRRTRSGADVPHKHTCIHIYIYMHNAFKTPYCIHQHNSKDIFHILDLEQLYNTQLHTHNNTVHSHD